jgi:HSP20 family molecular chaperone IbpA
LSKSIDVSKIEACFDNGKLKIKLPKLEKVKPRTIEVR